jgi:hypothetical protein
MSQSLPTGGWRWMSRAEIDNLVLMEVPVDGPVGYILEVDLEYPNNLHDHHSDYPLAPENLLITDEMLSPWSKDMRDELQLSSHPMRKLTPNLYPKQKYLVHYRNLQLYLKLGMVLGKIHRVLRFNQSAWMAPYIIENTRMRQQATSDFEKNLYKLMNNSVFGKSMENVFRYKKIFLTADERKLLKLRSSPMYSSSEMFGEDLVAVLHRRGTVLLSKPIYTGFCVLELSKLLMYDFHYNRISHTYNRDRKRATLLFTDTDSLCYLVETGDIFKDVRDNADWFDTSDFPKDHPCFSDTNKKVLGKFKDELSGKQILSFVGLRAKMYSLLIEGGSEKHKAKGISKPVTKKLISHQDYLDALYQRSCMFHSMHRFQSFGHEINTVYQTKRSLSGYDDKRHILEGCVATVAHGHFRYSQPIRDDPNENRIDQSTLD